ncbi:nuclear transport factor 2 family protein [Pseudoclavibacter chungangensis]|uniref:Nuclear transport factor 2 family protein n=1 Tax=Pseudoclavibacter chungangensis TaxID=587635 RepID=A0A7J5C097_9MICO|nr:nuclear transport factor 2 family protein [Pseudoclavibacter chungangensis]KAB1660310.1 nuclear transport factor 2 family protein [Pseudoclavibacter chungangensis]NYJ65662.1 hypothetical protein [Pseudoclavibacter chungangensis]
MTTRDATGRTLDESEDLLLDAMRRSDVEQLRSLLADDLVFTLPDGTVVGREADLAAHRSGSTRFQSLAEIDRSTDEQDGRGRTRTRVDVVVIDRGDRIVAMLDYERSWSIRGGVWQVVSGSATPVL